MSKVNLKCTSSITPSFEADRLYKANSDKEGNIGITLMVDGKRKRIELSVGISGEVFLSSGGDVVATFLELKTKTLKCTRLIGPQRAGAFKAGKRYQVENGRPVGAVAGRIFDEDGYPYNLYRCEVGFECAIAKFEAKYL